MISNIIALLGVDFMKFCTSCLTQYLQAHHLDVFVGFNKLIDDYY